MAEHRMEIVGYDKKYNLLGKANKIFVSDEDFTIDVKYIQFMIHKRNYVFSVILTNTMKVKKIGMPENLSIWLMCLWLEVPVSVYNFNPYKGQEFLVHITFEIRFQSTISEEPFDIDEMDRDILEQFSGIALNTGQRLIYQFKTKPCLELIVKCLETVDPSGPPPEPKLINEWKNCNYGILYGNTEVKFEKTAGCSINLIKIEKEERKQPTLNLDWNFAQMGIGGLEKEFSEIFRRAFASRIIPPELIKQLGCKHVKGILLYGPPGTGKTLIARQIGKMLNAREPKIVNGPEIFSKWIGESEANIRDLFVDAEEEQKKFGEESGLHIIIFDEVDSICKPRGDGISHKVNENVVNQLLSKLDGIEQLNNILVIGLTNRKDMIDEAFLRPGRFEFQMEIGLPDEAGRLQILNIHTAKMREFERMDLDVDLQEIASKTKNFSGAELEGLVRAAQSNAINRLLKSGPKEVIDPEKCPNFLINNADFMLAIENDIKPAFGISTESFKTYLSRDIIDWGTSVSTILNEGDRFIQQLKAPDSSDLVSVLLEGQPNSGKTALAVKMALASKFPFFQICSPDDMIGLSESAKCNRIRKVFDDAYRSSFSCILIDDVERLLEYGPIGQKYSNLTLQALLVLLRKRPPIGRKLLILCTSGLRHILEDMGMITVFTSILNIPNLSKPEHVLSVFKNQKNFFNKNDLSALAHRMKDHEISIGIKKLLDLVDMMKQTQPEDRIIKLLAKLEEEGGLKLCASKSKKRKIN